MTKEGTRCSVPDPLYGSEAPNSQFSPGVRGWEPAEHDPTHINSASTRARAQFFFLVLLGLPATSAMMPVTILLNHMNCRAKLTA